MANQVNSNPKILDGVAAVFLEPFRVRLIQWVSTSGAITDNDRLLLRINDNVNLSYRIQHPTNAGFLPSCVLAEIGPFNPGIRCHKLTVNVINTGEVHVWTD